MCVNPVISRGDYYTNSISAGGQRMTSRRWPTELMISWEAVGDVLTVYLFENSVFPSRCSQAVAGPQVLIARLCFRMSVLIGGHLGIRHPQVLHS